MKEYFLEPNKVTILVSNIVKKHLTAAFRGGIIWAPKAARAAARVWVWVFFLFMVRLAVGIPVGFCLLDEGPSWVPNEVTEQ